MIYNYLNDGYKPGTYTVTLTVSNDISELTTSKTYTLQRRVENIHLLYDSKSVVTNSTTNWKLDFGSVGTDACYFMDFADPAAGRLCSSFIS